MKKNSLTDYLLYVNIKLISKFLIILPTGLIIWLAKIIGDFGFYFDVKHRRTAYVNVKIAFLDKKNTQELNRIVKGLFKNFMLNLFELLRLPLIDAKYVERFIEFEGKEHIDDAMKKNKGLIILAVHFGSWELANAVCATLNYPYKIIARQQDRNTRLDNLLNSYRQFKEGTIITRGDQTREILRSLKNNEIIGMVIDQGGRDGMPIKFFSKTASMHTGALRLALKFDIPIIMSFFIRQKGAQHKVVLYPINLEKSGDKNKDIRLNLEKVFKLAEELISKYPQQYLWFYKVWKYSDERSVVILNDGKTGHLRQSQAISKIILNELNKRGFKANTKIVKIEFKNNFSKIIVTLCSLFVCKSFFQGRLNFLKTFFTNDSFNNLTKISADFIISCGVSVAPINLILSGETKAKAVAILRPGILSFNKFDLVVLPKHDRPPKIKNIVETTGALNLIDKEYLDKQSELLTSRFPFLRHIEKKRIGVFIGGETKNYSLSQRLINSLIEQIKAVSEKFDTEILLTTSRRTPQQIDGLIKTHLGSYPKCKLLVIANENNFPEAVGGILGLSQIILISSDSISMISEAATSGKTVVVFRTQLNRNQKSNLRHQRFSDNLSKQGYIILVNAEEIEETIQNIIMTNKTTKPLQDNQIITEAIRKIL